ncbi:MAG: DUF2384 domain-containing protein [Lewinellaceae bacterium]|nr:DUF2384 domain-containing protein [candidate division KSB1 bacterium]MCB9035498.1 DUF2384 domain-containing protein [Lewinellaceae bacterium]
MTEELKQILGDKSIEFELENRLDLIKLSRKGLSLKNLFSILEYTSLTVKDLVKIIPLSERQLQRYSKDQILRTDISVQLLQISELYSRGYEVFGSREKFRKWMEHPNMALSSVKPIELLDTSFGIQLILDEIGRIEHGIVA